MLLKVISIAVWLIIAALTFFLVLLLLEPKSGGDPSTKGLGKSLNLMLIAAIVILIVLNLQPHAWSKYLGGALGILFAIGAIIVLLALSGSRLVFQDTRQTNTEADKPAFEDPILNELHAAFKNEDVETWKKLLQTHPSYVHDSRLMNQLLLDADYNGTSNAAHLTCLKYLFDSGVKFDPNFSANFTQIAYSGNADLVGLLLQYGADPNTKDGTLEQWPVIFETIAGHGAIDDVIRVLIKHGADPNVKIKTNYKEQDTITPLLYAVYRERWSCCTALLENGADLQFKTKEGVRIKDLVLQLAAENKDQDRSTNPEFWGLAEQIKPGI